MRKARILFVAPSAYVLGGLAAWLDLLLPGLARSGWDVVLGLVEGPRFHRVERYVAEHPFPKVVAIPCATGTPEGRIRALVDCFCELAPDLVASVNVPDCFLALDRLRGRDVASPVGVMTVHGIEVFPYEDMRTMGRAVDAVVCTNRLSCRLSTARGEMDPARVFYAPYGVVERGSGQARSASVPFRMAWAGRLDQWQKRVLDLPVLIPRLEAKGVAVEFLVAGDGPQQESLVASLADSIQHRVKLLGRVPATRMVDDVYRNVDALLVTSRWETGPIVIWEAMSMGLPVVSSRYVGSGLEAALVHQENSLLFDVGDMDTAAALVSRLATEPDLARHLREAGDELIRTRYSAAASIAAWNGALCAALATARRPFAGLVQRPVTSRLDAFLGADAGETLRRVLKRSVEAHDPGDEWPHSYSRQPADDPEFWRLAESLDKDNSRATQAH